MVILFLVSRVSLMKNGEEIVSVGGAMEPSAKNMGISASNSVLLDLAKVCVTVFICGENNCPPFQGRQGLAAAPSGWPCRNNQQKDGILLLFG